MQAIKQKRNNKNYEMKTNCEVAVSCTLHISKVSVTK